MVTIDGTRLPTGPAVVVFGDLTPDLVAAWDDLAERALEANPFSESAFVLPAARHLGDADVGLAVVSDGERLVAAMPVQRRRRWRTLPIPSVGNWVHDEVPLGTPLLADEAAAGALVAAVRRWSPQAPLVTLEQASADGAVHAAMLSALAGPGGAPITWESHDRALLDRHAHDDITAELLGDRYRRLPSKERGLARDLGDELRTVDRGDDPDAIEQLLRLEASGWKGEEGTALLSDPVTARFARATLARFREAGRLELLSLETEATGPVAMHANLVSGDALFHYKSAFDENHARRSPGTILLLEMVRHFDASGRRWLDSCTAPDNAPFNELLAQRRRIVRQVVPVVAPRTTGAAVRAAARLRGNPRS